MYFYRSVHECVLCLTDCVPFQAIENRISELEDSAPDHDIPGPPPSPKSLRMRPKLAVSCPQPVRKRSASDSNDLPYEVAESVLLTPTGATPHRKTFGSPRVASNKTAPPVYEHDISAKTFEQQFPQGVQEPAEGWRTTRVPEASPRLYWTAPDKPALGRNGQPYESASVPAPAPRYQQIDARAFVRGGKHAPTASAGLASVGSPVYQASESMLLTPTTIDENLVYYTGNPHADDPDQEHAVLMSQQRWPGAPGYGHGYAHAAHSHQSQGQYGGNAYGYGQHPVTHSGVNVNVHGGMGFTASLH